MSAHCVDAAYYWTPEEAAAIVDYLDRLRDTVWEMYSDDIISCRTEEFDAQVDLLQRLPGLDDEASLSSCQSQVQSSTPATRCDKHLHKPGRINEECLPREALPSLDDLPSLSDENVVDMLKLLRSLLHACEEHYRDPIRRADEQRHQELFPDCTQDLPMPSDTDYSDDF